MTDTVRPGPAAATLAAAVLAATPAVAVEPDVAGDAFWARMHDRQGERIGIVTFEATTTGTTLVTASFTDLPEGSHGFHIHETGACEPPFRTAGGHFAPRDHSHGILEGEGRHAGDMPNLIVPETGRVTVQHFVQGVSLQEDDTGFLLDNDGSAVIVHSGPDDYESQPAGGAGKRIACGVIEPVDPDRSG